MATDPFDALRLPDEPQRPSSAFTRALRARLADTLGLPGPATGPATPDVPPIELPPRRIPMPSDTTTAPATTPASTMATALTPYLAVHDAAAAIAFYTAVFGATEVVRMVGDDGRIGHAELHLGPARLFLADEYPEIGVTSPRTLNGTAASLHLEVTAVDEAFALAVAAGAEAVREPADQPHGARSATVLDPFGHRWMLSQPVAQLSAQELADQMGDAGWQVHSPDSSGPSAPAPDSTGGQIWAGIASRNAPGLIEFLVEVLGFEAQLVVEGDAGVVEHSQIRWPEGGIVMVSSADRDENVFSQRPVGSENLYVVTADPLPVLQRCRAAGAEVVLEPYTPDYDPAGVSFTVADPDGNLWTFGTYAGEPGPAA